MAKTNVVVARARAQGTTQATVATEQKCKRAAITRGHKKRVANETIGKWFPSVVSDGELKRLTAERSLSADLRCRMPLKEVAPTSTCFIKNFLGQGFGFPLHSFVRGLLFFFGCQLHNLTPNGILHIANFITFYESYIGTAPHFKLFRYFFCIRVQMNGEAIRNLGGVSLQL